MTTKQKNSNKSENKFTEKPLDIESIKAGLSLLIKNSDPMHRWVEVLNEVKPQIEEAISQGISLTKVRVLLKQNGADISQEILKKFLGIQKNSLNQMS